MIGLIIALVGTAAFVAIAKFFNWRDIERLARLLPPNKRFLLEDRKLPNYVK